MESFLEVGEGSGSGSAAGVTTSRIPHNWFGTGKFVAPQYSVATGAEECDVCKAMIQSKRKAGTIKEHNVAPKNLAEEFGCGTVDKKYNAMCRGYENYLNECPSFIHNMPWNVGGSESFVHLAQITTYYYCLRINPLYCIDTQ